MQERIDGALGRGTNVSLYDRSGNMATEDGEFRGDRLEDVEEEEEEMEDIEL